MMRALFPSTVIVVLALTCFHRLSSVAFAAEQGECAADGSCGDDVLCIDTNDDCAKWASAGECEANPNYMLYQCKKSCDVCHVVDPKELTRLAKQKLRLHKVGGDERLLETDHGMEQDVEGLDPDAVKQSFQEMVGYMQRDVQSNPKLKDVVCKNRQRDCLRKKLASDDVCSGASFKVVCAPVCQSCHVLDHNHRCPIDDSIPDAVPPGFLNEMFERIIADESYQEQYTPIIISKPRYYDAASVTKSEEFGNVTDADGPWVVVLDNFLSEKECEHMQEMGHQQGYARSADIGFADFAGKATSNFNDGRTSQNAWCTGKCAKDATAQGISQRMVQLTGIPDPNYEFLQILKYNVGQHYDRHHDYADYHLKRQYGPRVLTVFLYLNTVEKGGGTHFSALNLTVVPKQGRAVIWPSVLSEKPRNKDERTDHAALPVEAGIKFGANAWIHQRDFKEEHRKGCT